MTAMTEQRVPWLQGERRAAGAAGAVAARDQPVPPRRALPQQLPRARKFALLAVAVGFLAGAVAMCLGPLADRCGPVGDVKRCAGPPLPPVTSGAGPWKAAFESVVPASGAVLGAEPQASPVAAPVRSVTPLPTVRKRASVRANAPASGRTSERSRASGEPRGLTAGEGPANEADESTSDSGDE